MTRGLDRRRGIDRKAQKKAKRLVEKMPRRPRFGGEPEEYSAYGVRAWAWAERARSECAGNTELLEAAKQLVAAESGPHPDLLDPESAGLEMEELMERDLLQLGAPMDITEKAAYALWQYGAAPEDPGRRYMEVCRKLGNWHPKIAWRLGEGDESLVYAHRPEGSKDVRIWAHGEREGDELSADYVYTANDLN